MIGVDTNVLVRYMAQDDPEQCKAVNGLFEQASARNKVFVSVAVVVECLWVLNGRYRITDEQAHGFIRFLHSSKKVSLERPDVFSKVLAHKGTKAKDMDGLILAYTALDAGCSEFFTFDRRLNRLMSTKGT